MPIIVRFLFADGDFYGYEFESDQSLCRVIMNEWDGFETQNRFGQ